MSTIIREVTLTWEGKQYKVKVDMKLINRIEEDVNLMRLAIRMGRNDVPLSQVSTVFAHLLQAGGAEATPEDVWEAMFSNPDESQGDVIAAATLALNCVFPDVRVKGTTDPKPNRSTSTRGKTSTKRR